MAEFEYDLFVIGAGSGGVRASRIAASHGARVAVAEEHRVGGTCVIRGCVPKKLLVYGSHFAEDLHDAQRFGWNMAGATFDWNILRDNVAAEVNRLEGLYGQTLGNNKVEVFRERAVVTGPNMAGKSTFLRQNALLAVLAQAGAYVPATRLRIGVVDRLFSRVGAGDDLARGRSTFMTEMVETAAILTQATARSLVILDEIGRGTATYDGLAIAWACAEALHDVNRCRALFATHYHELAKLETRLASVGNLSLRAKEWNGDLVFLHEAKPGPADRSYGVQVAKLAGVPMAVVARAREVLQRLESETASPVRLDDLPLFSAVAAPVTAPNAPSKVEADLRALDLDGMSPREAMDVLYRLRGLID